MAWMRAAARFSGCLLTVLLFVLLIGGAGLWLFSEAVCQQALEFLLARGGYAPVRFTVRDVSLDHVAFESVRLDRAEGSFSATAVHVAFSPSGLRSRTLDALRLSGVEATLVHADGGWRLAGLSGDTFPKAEADSERGWHIRRIAVHESVIDVIPGTHGLTNRVELKASHLETDGPGRWKGAAATALTVVHPRFTGDAALSLDARLEGDLRRGADGAWRFRLAGEEGTTGLRASGEGVVDPGEPSSSHASFSVLCDDVSAAGELLSSVLPGDRAWSHPKFGGALSGSVALSAGPEGVEAKGTLRLHGMDITLPQVPMSVQGLEADLSIAGLTPLSTPPDQRLTFSSATLVGLPFEHGELRFRVAPTGIVQVVSFAAGLYGGSARLEPFSLDPAQPGIDLTAILLGMDMAQLAAAQAKVDCTAEGSVDGEVRVAWQPGASPRMQGHLVAPPGQKGRIRFADPSLLTRQMKPGDARIRTVALSLQDFRYDRFRVAVDLTDDTTATASLNLSGRSAREPDAPPVRLNVNFEADTEDVIYLGRVFGKLGRR